MNNLDWSLCVAPMLDWTNRHCRFFHRLLAPRARLYTEMITTGALNHGDVARHLDFDPAEHVVALQVGGSEPEDLAHAARLAERWGYDEINLNCGCPSERVQKGAFGACLMAEPQTVADGVKAMRDATTMPVTVKHRIGLDQDESYGPVRDFVGIVADAGCEVFIVHARNAVLKGLSPKENREIPPLRYHIVRQLQRDFPNLKFVLNGGLKTCEQSLSELRSTAQIDALGVTHEHPALAGVMIGREAWHRPVVLREISQVLWPDDPVLTDDAVVEALYDYATQQVAQGVPLRVIVKSLLAFTNGSKGARRWRQMLSDVRLLAANDANLIRQAWAQLPPQESRGL